MKAHFLYSDQEHLLSDAVIIKALTEAGFTPGSFERVQRYRRMAEHFGAIENIRLLRDPAARRLCTHPRLLAGEALHVKKLIKMSETTDKEGFRETLQSLIFHHVLWRGYQVTCPMCEQKLWYPLRSVRDEALCCTACNAPIQLPLEVKFSYQMNALFRKGFAQDGITSLLTLLHLSKECIDLKWGAGYRVAVGGTEIDLGLIVQCDEVFYVVECRDEIRDDSGYETIMKLQRTLTVAEGLKAAGVFLAALDNQLPQILEGIDAVHPITSADLLD